MVSGSASTTDCSSVATPTSRFENTETQSTDLKYPLWAFVTITKRVEEGGNKCWACNFCNETFTGSYTRVKAHLLQTSSYGIKSCSKVTLDYRAEMQKKVEEAENRNKPKCVPLPNSSSSFTHPPSAPIFEQRKRKSAGGSALEQSFGIQSRNYLNALIARMFYSAGLPFHFARNPYYVEAFSYAANNSISGYVPPGYNSLRCNLLVQEKVHIERLLKPLKGLWKEKGISIVTDGWTDAQRRPLINFMAASEGGPIFLSAIDGSKEYKDKHYIASLITNVIKEVGPQKVVQVITDNAPVCKAAGMLVQAEYPHIFWTPCVVHTLNLALKNICAAKNTERNEIVYNECWWITMVSDEAKIIKDFIMNHAMRLAIFNEFVPLKLLAVAETRFASTIVMLKRFKLIKHGLQSMVISDKWNAYREDSVGIAQTVKEIILNDLWWDKVDYILSFTGPIYDMLRLCDTDKPTLHLVYDMWDSMIEQVRTVIFRQEKKEEDEVSDFYNVVYAILIDRWTKSCTPLHCLAHSLNPRYYSKQWLEGLPNRVPPHKDVEISAERNKCFLKYFPIAEERRFVNIEFARFSGCMDVFASFDSLQDRWDLDPKMWWLVHGSSASLLQNIALKLLGQPCSSSCCERNWSTYSFIHSMRRNKITPQRAEDLVYVHTNLRLLSRKNESYNKGETKMWDIGGDHFDPLEGSPVAALILSALGLITGGGGREVSAWLLPLVIPL
ncbi:Dimer_Tnp_hAT domain-containing protein [Quillaja saponaria]|uniref:Dimer_Tnp_hAT domain-containing protein n=1 Tax=Quillaja saponaria TaxID=32244 RepID=A0AAD7PX28_QUISA|nr:Dimer_Tnp_hAT domain-containing protein [Quillaja saponaria]